MKNIFFYIIILVLPYLGFSMQLEEISHHCCAQIIDLLDDQLLEHPDWLDINNHEIKNFNLSDRNIGYVNFNGWLLVNIDFTNSDLTEVQFSEAKSEGVKLGGAVLCKGLKLGKRISAFRLVKLYSKFTKQGNGKKVQALNNIIGFLPLNLTGKDLSNLDLTNINLKLATLNNTNLINTILIDSKLPVTINSEHTITYEEDYLSILINKESRLNDHNLKNLNKGCGRIMVSIKSMSIVYAALLILSSPLIEHIPITIYLVLPAPFASLFLISDCFCKKKYYEDK